LIRLCGIHGKGMIEYGTCIDWYWQGKFKLFGGKPVTVPHWLPQIPHGIVWDQTRIIWLKLRLSYIFRIGTGFVPARLVQVCACCEYVNEQIAMMKSGECFDQLSKCWLPKERVSACICTEHRFRFAAQPLKFVQWDLCYMTGRWIFNFLHMFRYLLLYWLLLVTSFNASSFVLIVPIYTYLKFWRFADRASQCIYLSN